MSNLETKLRHRRRRVFWGTFAYVLLGVPALVWAADGGEARMIWAIAAFMVVGVTWVGGLFVAFRCPRCGTHLGEDAAHSTLSIEWTLHLLMQPARCPECRLDEADLDDVPG